jgi:hypothetical protein
LEQALGHISDQNSIAGKLDPGQQAELRGHSLHSLDKPQKDGSYGCWAGTEFFLTQSSLYSVLKRKVRPIESPGTV